MSDRSLGVLLATVGSRGDVQPMLALAQAFAERGHRPLVAAPPNFEAWVRGLGLAFAPLGVDMQVFLERNVDIMTGHPLKMARAARRFFADQVPVQADQLLPLCQGQDALVFGGLARVAPTIAEHLRLPALGVQYTTCMLASSLHPPPAIPRHGLPHWLNRLMWRMDRVVGNLVLCRSFNAARERMGMPPIRQFRGHVFEDCPQVIAADEPLFPPDPAWQGRYPYANFIYFEDPQPLDPDLDAWLRDGEPPVFVGFGSMSGEGTQRIEAMIIEAVAATGRRCIVGAGWAGLGGAGALPAHWRVVRDAPHALLFPRMAVVVHHGGSGTTAQALRAGVPQVLLPLILDQFHHAHRLHLAGLIPRPVRMEHITAPELTAAIQAALALPRDPMQVVAHRLRASSAVQQIVGRVEALVAAAPRGLAAEAA